MATPAVVVQLAAQPTFLTPVLTSRWDDTVTHARRAGLTVSVQHLPMQSTAAWDPFLGAGQGDEDDVVVVARPQDLPSNHLVAELVAALEAGADLVAPRVLPFEPGVPEDASVADALVRARDCVALRVGTLRRAWDAATAQSDDLDQPQDHDQALAALVDAVRRAGGVVRLVPAASLYRDRRIDEEGQSRDPDVGSLLPVEPGPVMPGGHPAVMPDTALNQLLSRVQLAGIVADALPAPTRTPGPFLSVVTRTRGTRPLMLADTLTSLAAQTDRDFEVLLVCHGVDADQFTAVHEVLASQPKWLRERVRVLKVDRHGRSAPLNEGLDHAVGRYVTVLDDDDTVLGHWVAAYRALEQRAPGRVLRCATARQYHDQVGLDGDPAGDGWPVATGPVELAWPLHFDLIAHLHVNSTPNMSAAFPRGLVRQVGLRFDESLHTTEDWDFLVRAVALVGVVDDPEVTAVYRWFTTGSSREEHGEETWDRGHRKVRASLDRMPVVLPPGAASHAVEAEEERLRLRTHVGYANDRLWLLEGAPSEDLSAEDEDWLVETEAALAETVGRLQARLEAVRERLAELS